MSMNILVMSDTHGNSNLALKACQSANADTIIHLGDGGDDADLLSHVMGVCVIAVAGNCDRGYEAPRERLWECAGKRILLTHGDAYGVKGGMGRLEQRGRELGVDAVLYGHTHIPAIHELSGILFVNPGTLVSTSHATCAMLEISDAGISARIFDIP